MTPEQLEHSVESMIAEAVDRLLVPDAGVIADALLDQLDPEQLHAVARKGLKERVSNYFNTQRHGNGNGPSPSARVAAVRAAIDAGEFDLNRFTVWTGAKSKWLLDCSLADLIDAADWSLARAGSFEKRAEQYGKLANLLKRRKVKKVSDLPLADVRRIFDA